MNLDDCSRAEIVAGAVALGEASDAERTGYRDHLSGCRRCLSSLGGEYEIQRTMDAIARVRETESWEPDVRTALRERARARRRTWQLAGSASAAVIVAAFAAHAFFVEGAARIGVTPAHPIVIGYDGRRIVVEHSAAAAPHVSRAASHSARHAVVPQWHAAVAPGHDVVVVHNVVTLKRPARVPLASAALPARTQKSKTVPRIDSGLEGTTVAAVLPSQRDKRAIAALRTGPGALPAEGRAESIAVIPSTVVVRDVVPIGGANAIVPRPSSIAYYENAEGTTAFDVTVDERGLPVKCTITKGSGYLVLDDAVCRAAMRARYSPRTINGRAVVSLYHDAFTFRSSDDQ